MLRPIKSTLSLLPAPSLVVGAWPKAFTLAFPALTTGAAPYACAGAPPTSLFSATGASVLAANGLWLPAAGPGADEADDTGIVTLRFGNGID